MKKFFLTFAMMAIVFGATALSVQASENVGDSPLVTASSPALDMGSKVENCTKEIKDANGKVIQLAGCTEHAMPCMTNNDCCSGKCQDSACVK